MNTGFVLRLINTYGEPCVFSTDSVNDYDPANASNDVTSSTAATVNGVPVAYTANEIDGTLVQIGDVKLYIANTGYSPVVNDRCLINSIEYRVMSIIQTRVTAQTVLYTLGLRK